MVFEQNRSNFGFVQKPFSQFERLTILIGNTSIIRFLHLKQYPPFFSFWLSRTNLFFGYPGTNFFCCPSTRLCDTPSAWWLSSRWGDRMLQINILLFSANQYSVFKDLKETTKISKKANKSRPLKITLTN